MADLKGLYREALKEHPLVVTAPHSQWLLDPEELRVHTPEAIQFVADALAGKFKHSRSGRFSPSSIGGCKRKLIYGFEGAPQEPDDIDSPDMMGLGSWGHLKWQCEGISREWIRPGDAELWTFDPDWRVGGSIDAFLYDDSIFELKTLHPFKYTRIIQTENAVQLDHQMQAAVYTLLEGVSMVSVVYEDRSAGAFYEFRMEVDDKLVKMVTDVLDEVNNHVEDATMPPMLDPCTRKTGQAFKQCPYRKHCPAMAKLAGQL